MSHATAFELPTSFVAYSGDVRSAAHEVLAELRELSAHVFASRLQGYCWEIDPYRDGWGAQNVWQEHIVGPQKENCINTFVVVGERIGLTLPNIAYSKDMLKQLSGVAADLGLKLTLDRARHRDEVPLTGTVLELLSSLRSGRDTYVFVKGGASVLDAHLSLFDRNFGFGQHLSIARANDPDAYDYQRLMLSRLLDAFAGTRPNVRHFVSDQHLRSQVRQILASKYQISMRPRDEVFRALRDYAIEDSDVFFGRSRAVADLIAQFEVCERAGHVPILVLRGPSGGGKSSLAKAGVAATLKAISKLPGQRPFEAVSFDADDLNNIATTSAVFGFLAKRLIGVEPSSIVDESSFCNAIERSLKATQPAKSLVIVIDQFEGALALDDARFAAIWSPVISALRRLGLGRLAWTIITHPTTSKDSRWDRLRTTRTDLVQRSERHPQGVMIDSTARSDLAVSPREVVAGVFRAGRVRITEEAKEFVIDQFRLAFPDDDGSALPYLSAYCASVASLQGDDPDSALDRLGGDATLADWSDSAIGLSDLSHLRFDTVIDSLGERALERYTTIAGTSQGTDALLSQLFGALARVDVSSEEDLADGSKAEVTDRWVLPSAPVPTEIAARSLVDVLAEQRLIKMPAPSRMQLTHEVILSAWRPAKRWLDRQRPALKALAALATTFDVHRGDKSLRIRGDDLLAGAELLLASSLVHELSPPQVGLICDSLVENFGRRLPSLGLNELLQRALASQQPRILDGYMKALSDWAKASKADRRKIVDDLNRNWGVLKAPIVQYAAIRGHDDLVKRLCTLGAHADGSSEHGVSLLHVAAEHLAADTVKWLLSSNKGKVARLLSQSDWRGETPLHGAARWGRRDVVELLLSRGATSAPRHEFDNTPLHLAASNALRAGSSDTKKVIAVLRRSFERGAKPPAGWYPNDAKWTSLSYAARSGDLGALEAILDRVTRCPLPVHPESGSTPLHLAAKYSHVECVRALLKWMGDGHSGIDAQDVNKRTALHNTALAGSLDVAKLLIAAGANPVARDAWGNSPIRLACRRGHGELALGMLEDLKEAKVDELSGALAGASWSGDIELVRKLIALGGAKELGSCLNEPRVGVSPLQAAAARGHTAIVDLLVKEGARVDCKGAKDFTPLHAAAHYGWTDTAEFLLGLGASLEIEDDERRLPTHEAAFQGRTETLLMLLTHASDEVVRAVDRYEKTILHSLFEGGEHTTDDSLSKAWRVAVARGVRPLSEDEQGRTAFYLGLRHDRPALRDFGASHPDVLVVRAMDEGSRVRGLAPIHNAALHDAHGLVEFILKHRPAERDRAIRVNVLEGMQPIHCAAMNGSVNVLKVLIEAGASVEARDGDGQTPLMIAIRRKHATAVRFLLKQGGNVFAENSRGRTAIDEEARFIFLLNCFPTGLALPSCARGETLLHLASRYGFAQAISRLCLLGARPNIHDEAGRTPLHLAAAIGHLECVKSLLSAKGVDVNLADKSNGKTALHKAAYRGRTLIAKALLDAGADPRLKDNDGKSALDAAIDADAKEPAAELLRLLRARMT